MKTEQQHIGSEAAIWADGTEYSRDQLVRLYEDHCREAEEVGEEPTDCQRFFRSLGIAN
jgi:hypothetical protein